MSSQSSNFDLHYINIVKQLESSLGIKSTNNLNLDIDLAVKKSKEGNKDAQDWLILNFLPLIIKISFSPSIRVKNAYSGSLQSFYFPIRDSEQEVKDLLSHLIQKFCDFINDYTWDSAFNYWIEMRLKWACINFRNNLKKIRNREFSLDEKLADLSGCDSGNEEATLVEITDERDGMWNLRYTVREKIEDKNFTEVVNNFIKNNFEKREYEIFKMFFIDGMSILDITAYYRQTYHSTISCTVSKLRKELREFLSKIDEEYDEMYQKCLDEEESQKVLPKDLPSNTDYSCDDLMPVFCLNELVESISNNIESVNEDE